MKKTVIGLGIGLLLVCSLAGCGKKKNTDNQNPARVKDYVYRMEEVQAPSEDMDMSQMIQIQDKIYAYAYEWYQSEEVQPREAGAMAEISMMEDAAETQDTETEEDGTEAAQTETASNEEEKIAVEDMPMGESVVDGFDEETQGETSYFYISLYEIKEDGTLGEPHQIEGKDGESYGTFCADEEGNLYCIRNEYSYGESESDYYDDYYLEQITLDGEVKLSVKLNDVPEIQKTTQTNGYFGASDMFIVGENIYINCSGEYLKFDRQGNYIGKMLQSQYETSLQGSQILKMKDNRYAALTYGENGMTIAPVDVQKGTVGESYTLPGNSYDYSFYPGYEYDFLLSDTYGVYGYNLGDQDKVKLLSYVDSDIDTWRISQIIPVSATEFYGTYDESTTGRTRIAKFIKVPSEEVKDKQVLTLAMASTDYSIKSRVIAFNKSNEKYRIDLQDYSSMYTETGDYSEGITKMNTDIVSGKIPDIILVDNSMPVDSYISKGLFADLYSFIDKDDEIDRDDLMPNILDAFSENGKLYVLVPAFRVQTLIAKTSDVGAERGWTVQEAMKLWDSKPEGTEFLPGATRSDMLYTCMSFAGSQFVDYETGKCNFDTDDFALMLEFLKRFPVEIGEDYYSDTYWENYDSMWRDGRVITQQYYLTDFRDLNYAKKGTFGEDITLIGFPSADKDGSAIMPALQLAISSKSKNQEGAWEFLRYYLTDEYQKEASGFPLSMKYLAKKAEEATKRPYYIDDDGKKVEYDDSLYIGGLEIKIDPMSKEEVNQYVEVLKSFTQVSRYDETLMGIITEEAEPFFSGQKSAQEVTKIIQSRAQVYLNEIR